MANPNPLKFSRHGGIGPDGDQIISRPSAISFKCRNCGRADRVIRTFGYWKPNEGAKSASFDKVKCFCSVKCWLLGQPSHRTAQKLNAAYALEESL